MESQSEFSKEDFDTQCMVVMQAIRKIFPEAYSVQGMMGSIYVESLHFHAEKGFRFKLRTNPLFFDHNEILQIATANSINLEHTPGTEGLYFFYLSTEEFCRLAMFAEPEDGETTDAFDGRVSSVRNYFTERLTA